MTDSNRTGFGNTAARLLTIGGLISAVASAFAWTAGWLDPTRLTPQRLIDQVEHNIGVHAGYRRAHAKGMCVTGYFEGNGQASAYSRASVFTAERIPVLGRFATANGNPHSTDDSVPVRSLALRFDLPDGQQWRTAMNAIAVAPFATPQTFYDQAVASRPDPATGKPDPAVMQAFFDAHPDTLPFRTWIKSFTPSSSWANGTYNGLDAFRLLNAQGNSQAVRWSMVSELPYAPLADTDKTDPDFLHRDLQRRLNQGELRFHLILTLAAASDPTNNATLAWPAERQQIDAGTLVLQQAISQDEGACRDVNYDPTILPDGIATSDDPLLGARSAVYSESFNRRTFENASASTSTRP
ncbi:catalase family peroxidase [Azomonas macrocytogenes]|uniref:Catalase-related peroxidase n=1 Tax=Azomonas macrocytogenes TaxID=69962 RepID=A0A839T679_AZOMA|nr:catalase family peroxidase [Azomonas macrocytogenes]MBB3103455.1 catalase [Azomonas macrocytogenes]